MLKKILIVIATLIAIMLFMRLISWWIVSSGNAQKGNKEEKLSSNRQSPKKALIIYQPSKSAISSRIAHQIAKGMNDGCYEVILNYPGDHLSTDLSQYSVIVFGSPVYGEQPSKALIDYMSKIKGFPSQKIVLYTTGSVKNTMGYDGLTVMEKFLNGTKAVKKIKFLTKERKKNDPAAYNLGKELTKE